MIRSSQIIWLVACAVFVGCVSTQSKIESERRLYLADPTMPSYGYDGKLTKGGEHYRFLFERDSAFGEFLIASVPSAKDPRIVVAALTFFGTTHPDPLKFERVVASIDSHLLDEEVNLSSSDVIMMVSLREWIADAKKRANQALQHNDPSCHVSCLRTPRASWGRG
jgi:hypothetical protein